MSRLLAVCVVCWLGCNAHENDTAARGKDAAADSASGASCTAFDLPAPAPSGVARCDAPLPTVPRAIVTENLEGGVVVHRNLTYAKRGGVALEGDLYLPTGRSGLLVVVHGGGWLDCDNRRDTMGPYAEAIARLLGVATLNIEYRLTQEGGGYPANVQDVICAIQWAHAHVQDYKLDDRVGIVGTSAGGHLALMAGLVGTRADLDPGCGGDARLDLVLSYAGPTDLPAITHSTSTAKEAPALYTGEPCEPGLPVCKRGERACQRCADASPLVHACEAEAPILLMQAPDPYDKLIPEAQARTFAQALEASGRAFTLLVPTDAEMRANGCTPEGGSHALDACMLGATQNMVNPMLWAALGMR